jgi:3-hydroxyacyl-[acyl-carrier-protein] dehydratase
MLLNDFYTYVDVSRDENKFSCKVVFNEAHDIFRESTQPVVPGVCMMEMVKELLQQTLGMSLWLRNAVNVKFLQLITADVQPVIDISWDMNETGRYMVDASFKNGDNFFFELGGNFEYAYI